VGLNFDDTGIEHCQMHRHAVSGHAVCAEAVCSFSARLVLLYA
jgi:hypothetical protein